MSVLCTRLQVKSYPFPHARKVTTAKLSNGI